jgi:hypothetical protein
MTPALSYDILILSPDMTYRGRESNSKVQFCSKNEI